MVPVFAKGGEASIEALTALANASNMADEEEGPKVEEYVGQARQMLDQVAPKRRAVSMPRGPGPSRGGAESPKEMDMPTESLMAAKDYKPKGKVSAKAQLRELARQYALRQRAATEESKGLSKNTFGAPNLEKPTLLRESLAVKRFEKGGEAKKDEGGKAETSSYSEGLPAPSFMNATMWADTVSREMYPAKVDNAKRDAARHMLAAAILADKTGTGVAKFMGGAHEFKEAPLRTMGHWLGLSSPRADYPTDMHNNALGAELHGTVSDPAKLEQAVMSAIERGSREGIEPGRVSLMPDDPTGGQYGAVSRADGSPEEGETVESYRASQRKRGGHPITAEQAIEGARKLKGTAPLYPELATELVDFIKKSGIQMDYFSNPILNPHFVASKRPVEGSKYRALTLNLNPRKSREGLRDFSHEMTHAADSVMEEEFLNLQSKAKQGELTPVERQFVDGYKKLYQIATKLPIDLSKDKALSDRERRYRTSADELRAFGTGNMAQPFPPESEGWNYADIGRQLNPHVDPTMATEAAVMRSLYLKKKAKK